MAIRVTIIMAIPLIPDFEIPKITAARKAKIHEEIGIVDVIIKNTNLI
tara:strand:- start:48634 stop:48777 length:144 start_codon:yes stop_codon:yes gene_type:complete